MGTTPYNEHSPMHVSAGYSLVANIAMLMVERRLPLHYISDDAMLEKVMNLVWALDNMGLANDPTGLQRELMSGNTRWGLTYNMTDPQPSFYLYSHTTGHMY